MKFFHKTLFPLYALVVAPIVPSLMFEMCENYVHSSAQTLNFSNETIITMEPSTDVNFVVGEMMEPTVSPSFDPRPVASTQSVDLGYCVKTFAQQEVEPAIISLASGLFDASSTGFELIRKYIEGFINDILQEVEPAIISLCSDLSNTVTTKFEQIRKYIEGFISDMLQEVEPAIISLGSDLSNAVTTKFEQIRKYIEALINDMYYAADLFDITNAKFEHIFDIMVQVNNNDLFDSIITTKFEGFHHFSSAPMVTGNLTGSAINLGRIDNGDSMVFELIPANTGCTIPVFSLDYILEWTDQEGVFVKSPKQGESSSYYFMLEFLARSGAFLESIVSSILDRILLEYQRVTETLESYYNEYVAASSAPPPPSSWVGYQLFIAACEKLEALVADFFAPLPPPPPINFQVFAMKSLKTLPFVCIFFLIWHAINRNRRGIQ